VDQEDLVDHNPPWWTRSGFYILLMVVLLPAAFLSLGCLIPLQFAPVTLVPIVVLDQGALQFAGLLEVASAAEPGS